MALLEVSLVPPFFVYIVFLVNIYFFTHCSFVSGVPDGPAVIARAVAAIEDICYFMSISVIPPRHLDLRVIRGMPLVLVEDLHYFTIGYLEPCIHQLIPLIQDSFESRFRASTNEVLDMSETVALHAEEIARLARLEGQRHAERGSFLHVREAMHRDGLGPLRSSAAAVGTELAAMMESS